LCGYCSVLLCDVQPNFGHGQRVYDAHATRELSPIRFKKDIIIDVTTQLPPSRSDILQVFVPDFPHDFQLEQSCLKRQGGLRSNEEEVVLGSRAPKDIDEESIIVDNVGPDEVDGLVYIKNDVISLGHTLKISRKFLNGTHVCLLVFFEGL
jgi:hypothetical protein